MSLPSQPQQAAVGRHPVGRAGQPGARERPHCTLHADTKDPSLARDALEDLMLHLGQEELASRSAASQLATSQAKFNLFGNVTCNHPEGLGSSCEHPAPHHPQSRANPTGPRLHRAFLP